MSIEITTIQKQKYQAGIEMLAQQDDCILGDRVRREAERGKRVSFDQIGLVAAKEAVIRHQDTQYLNTPHRRRWVSTKRYDLADLLDLADLVKIIDNPGGVYSKAFVAGLNRAKDKAMIDAALGTSYSGEEGTTAIAFPAAQQIAVGGTGFTFAKLQDAAKRLKAANAVRSGEEMTIVWTAAQEQEFLNVTEVKSSDYNNTRVLVNGQLDTFYGFRFVRIEDWTDENGFAQRMLPKVSTTRSCLAFVKSGLLLNEVEQPQVNIDQLPAKKYSWQYYGYGDWGATRMQEAKVVQIDVLET